jgi:DNA-binding NtrC family response regulator
MAVVICESQLPDGDWKLLLDGVSRVPSPPLMIVASTHADDALWAEVLNMGAYDVLSKPFDRTEVTRIISLAWLHWKDQVELGRHGTGMGRVSNTFSATA